MYWVLIELVCSLVSSCGVVGVVYRVELGLVRCC